MKNGHRWFLILGGILTAVVLASWPLAWELEHLLIQMSEPRDFHCGVWIPWNFLQQMKTGGGAFQAPDMYWPDGFDTTLYFWNFGIPALQVPFFLLTHALRAAAVSFLFFAFLDGLAGFILGRVIGRGSDLAGVAGALVLVASPYSWSEMLDGRVEPGFTAFLALAVAALFVLVRESSRPVGLAAGLATAAAGICYWFHGYFLALVAGALFAWRLLARRLERRSLQGWIAAGVTAVLLALPFALPVLLAAAEPGSAYQVGLEARDSGSPRILSFVTLNSLAWPFSPLPARMPANMVAIAPKILLLAGLFWGPVRRRAGWVVWLGIVALILSLGPELYVGHERPVALGSVRIPLPFAALYALPGFERFWWANRWLALVQVAAAGIAAAAVVATPRRVLRLGGLAVLGVVVLLETQASVRLQIVHAGEQARFEPHPFLLALAQEPGEHPLVQVPMRFTGYPLWMTYHLQPVLGGVADGEPVLSPPGYQRRLAEVPVFQALDQLSRGEEPRHPVQDLEIGLCDEGFHYLLLWRRSVQIPGTEARLLRLMPRPPDLSDDALLVWRLQPCGAQGPLLPAG